MIKLIVCDLDGTLLEHPYSEIPEPLFPLIRIMKERGIQFAAATGRQPNNVRDLFRKAAGEIYLICDNGGTTYDWDRLLRVQEMHGGREEELIDDIMNTPGVYLEMTGITTGFMPESSEPLRLRLLNIHEEMILEDVHDRPEPITKISLNELGHERVRDDVVRFFQEKYGDLYAVVQSGNGWLDIYSKDCGKGTALLALMDRLGLRMEEVVVFGDNENDVQMLRAAGLSYAREHSPREVQKIAGRVTADPVAEIAKLLKSAAEERE